MLTLLCPTKLTAGISRDNLLLLFLRYSVTSLTDAFTSVFNISLCAYTIHGSLRPVTIVSIPKTSNSSILTKRFRTMELAS